MIQFIKPGTNINFIGKRNIAIAISVVFIIAGLISIALKGGFNYGIDFSGGTMVQLLFKEDVHIDKVRNGLVKIAMGDSIIQHYGSSKEVIIRTKASSDVLEDIGKKIKGSLESEFPKEGFEVRRVEMVGPKVGKDLRQKALLSLFYAMLFMLAYIWWRFEFAFGLGAIIALAHDVLITVGVISITNTEFDLTIVAALLTIVGYSINDTIVVYDRIRENLKDMRREGYAAIINRSINETLSRTILTSFTVFLVAIILFLFGGEVIHGFSLALVIGVIAGTYSSIYIASPIVIFWEGSPSRRLSGTKA
ncbi:MAG: protein translocase subunit SecF [Nitrospinae bacterium]|nr:protein translocase subunit SecF [Nitrospinota bacterium]